jgi:hypothetical protein
VEFSTSFVTFLKFALRTVEDVVKGETALARRAHATAHTDKPMRVHRKAPLAGNGWSLTVHVEGVSEAGGGCHVLVVA